jgi:hypothetical protein
MHVHLHLIVPLVVEHVEQQRQLAFAAAEQSRTPSGRGAVSTYHQRSLLNLYACTISLQEYTSSCSIWKVWRRDTSGRPHIATRTRPELGGPLTTPRRSPHALGSAAQQCAGAPQCSEDGGWTYCETHVSWWSMVVLAPGSILLSPEVSECQRCRRCRGSVEAVSRQCRLTLVSMVSRCVDPCRPVSTRVRGRIDSLYARHMS